MGVIKSAVADGVITFGWVFCASTLGAATAVIASMLGLSEDILPWASLAITTALVFVLVTIFDVIGNALGGASFNPTATASFYAAGVGSDDLLSMALRFPAQVKVSEIVGEDGWRWKPTRLRIMQIIQEEASGLHPLPSSEDRIYWIPGPRNFYTTTSAWECIRDKGSETPWHKLLWNQPVISRHNFISWLAVKNKLNTLDRVVKWNPSINPSCIYCQLERETRNHLFFGCTSTRPIWEQLLTLNGKVRHCLQWDTELDIAAKEHHGKQLPSIVYRLSWHAFIYFIWKTRNEFIFAGTSFSRERILARIKFAVRCRLLSLTHLYRKVKTDDHRKLLLNWGMPQ